MTLTLSAGCKPDPRERLLPVSLPNLDGLPQAAQEQLRQQHARTLAVIDSASVTALGSAHGILGQLLFTYDFLDAAEPAFQNAHRLVPDQAQWPYYLGMLYRQQGHFEAATVQFAAVLERHPTDAMARLRLAESQLALGEGAEARPELRAVIASEPGNALAHFLLGQIAFEAEAYDSAVVHYKTVLELQPTATQVHAPLAMAYRNLGDNERSRYHLGLRGQTLVSVRDPRVVALEAFKQASGATGLTDGQRLIEAGRYDEAIAALEKFVSADSSNPSAFLSLGVARAYAGDRGGAIEALNQSLQLDPTGSKAHYNLGALYAASGDSVRAAARYRDAIKHDSLHHGARVELAEMLRRGKRCREAVEHFRVALEINAGNVVTRQHLVFCYVRLGLDAQARALLEDGLAGNPDHLGLLDGLARVLAASPRRDVRDGARALPLAEEAVKRRHRTETLETLAMAYAELGRYDEAVRTQAEAIEAASRRSQDAYVAHLRRNLERYQRGLPSRTPWPDFIYEM